MRAAAGLVALWLAGHAPAQADLDRLVRQLGSDDHRASFSAFQELSRRTDAALVPLLVEAVAGWPRHAQQHAVQLLAQRTRDLPKGQSRAVWKKVGDSGPTFLRVAAGVQLLDLDDARSAAAQLAAALRAVPEPERGGLVHLLYNAPLERDDELFAALCAWLHPGVGGGTAAAVLQRLRRLPTRSAAVRAAAAPLATAADPGARAAALAYLAGVDAAAADALAALLTKEPQRLGPVRGLLDGDQQLPKPLLEAIAATLRHATSEHEVRQTAALLRQQGANAAVAELRGLLQHEQPKVRQAALEALGELADGLDAALLQQLLRGSDVAAALVAADVLRRRDDGSGLEVVLAARPQPGAAQVQLAEVLGRFRDRRVGPRLLDLLDHAEPEVRRAAWQGLQEVMRGLFPYRRFEFEAAGYAPDAPSRQAGIAALRAWWDAAAKPQ